jgi:plasmid stabilization system protein ParE
MKMGHSSIKVTMDIYGHLLRDSNPNAAARLEELIDGAAETLKEKTVRVVDRL